MMKKLLVKYGLFPDKADIKSLVISFIIVNFAFLYNTLNFIWGNHDDAFVKGRLFLSSGLFEGRFTQFIPYVLLTNGQILPILNNLLGFAALVLGLWLLARYWNLPKNVLNYTLFITFFATQPYTLSWVYFSFITISCLFWVFCAILGLCISEYVDRCPHKWRLVSFSCLCFYLPLGGYPPIINTIAVCLMGRILLAYLFEKRTLKKLCQRYSYTVLAFFMAAVLFKLTLRIVRPEHVYNLETVPIGDMVQKLLSVMQISCKQFILSLPFMEIEYKSALLAMVFAATIGVFLRASSWQQGIISLGLFILVILAAGTTTFLVVPHTEYVARIDFYGLGFVYAFSLALLLKFKMSIAHSLALAFIAILLPWNILNDYRAQKIWQQGFDAEFQILDRLTERIENHPNFKPSHTYRFRQLGDISMRPRYYTQKFLYNEPFLYALPYLAMWQGGVLAEFYSPYDYINHQEPLMPSDITSELRQFIMEKARPWPHENAVYIDDNVILVILAQNELDEFRKMIANLY